MNPTMCAIHIQKLFLCQSILIQDKKIPYIIYLSVLVVICLIKYLSDSRSQNRCSLSDKRCHFFQSQNTHEFLCLDKTITQQFQIKQIQIDGLGSMTIQIFISLVIGFNDIVNVNHWQHPFGCLFTYSLKISLCQAKFIQISVCISDSNMSYQDQFSISEDVF